MILAFIRSVLLGPTLAPLFDYVTTHPELVAIFCFIVGGLYLAGRIQLENITEKTRQLVLQRYQEETQRRSNISAIELYSKIYPDWTVKVRQWGWFIPHRLDLWPVPVTPENVQKKFTFDKDWVQTVLEGKKIKPESKSKKISKN